MALERVRVKEEAERSGAAAGLYAEHEVKRELVLDQQGSAATPPAAPGSDEECIVKQEAAEVEDSGQAPWSLQASTEGTEEAGWSGVSAAAARAGLYDEHEVKHELVLGPERTQPQDIAYTLAAASNRAEECVGQEPVLSSGEVEGTGGSAWPAQNLHLSSFLEQQVHRTCFVRLQHLPADSEPCQAQHQAGSRHTRANVHFYETHRKRFPSKNELIMHKRIHPKKKSFICDICKKQYTRKGNLVKHMSIHMGKNPLTCEICKKYFRKNTSLNNHKRIHMGDKPFTCDICKKQFRKNGKLQKHMRIHTGEKPLTCEICNELFSHASNLFYHMRTHTGEKAFTCEICKMQFTQNSNLRNHMRIHKGQTPFTCEICMKQFPHNSSLMVHMRYHREEKPFKCEICKKQFTEKCNLLMHMRIHTGKKSFTCEICKKQFTQNGNLQRHMKTHTEENS